MIVKQDEGKPLNGSAYDSVGGGFYILIMLMTINFKAVVCPTRNSIARNRYLKGVLKT